MMMYMVDRGDDCHSIEAMIIYPCVMRAMLGTLK